MNVELPHVALLMNSTCSPSFLFSSLLSVGFPSTSDCSPIHHPSSSHFQAHCPQVVADEQGGETAAAEAGGMGEATRSAATGNRAPHSTALFRRAVKLRFFTSRGEGGRAEADERRTTATPPSVCRCRSSHKQYQFQVLGIQQQVKRVPACVLPWCGLPVGFCGNLKAFLHSGGYFGTPPSPLFFLQCSHTLCIQRFCEAPQSVRVCQRR